MVDFFYGLPIWIATVLVLGAALAVGLGSSFGLRYIFHRQSTTEDIQTALSLMQVVAAYIGILIAFAGVQVWQDFSDAENAVHREAASASQLYRDLATYGSETLPARRELRVYIDTVVHTNGRSSKMASRANAPTLRCSSSSTRSGSFTRPTGVRRPFTPAFSAISTNWLASGAIG